MTEQAMRARLTAIAEQYRQVSYPQHSADDFAANVFNLDLDGWDVVREELERFTAAITEAEARGSAHVETLTQQVAELRQQLACPATVNAGGYVDITDAAANLARAEYAEDLNEELRQENARLTAECKRLDNAVAEVRDNVHHVVQQAWVKPHDYDDSPLDLIAAVIDERDEAEQDLTAARAALMEIRVEAAMGAYTSDGTIGGGLTAIGCLDIVSACDAALQSVPPAEKGWQPIATAPKDGTSVLVRAGKLVPIVGRCQIDGQWRMQFDAAWSSPLSQPTHWMPLPPAPAQDGTGDIP